MAIDRRIHTGDLIVCRVNGTSDIYVIGTVVSGKVGALSLRDLSTVLGRDAALRQAYEERLDDHQVWLFDGAAAAYVETSVPPLQASPTTKAPRFEGETHPLVGSHT